MIAHTAIGEVPAWALFAALCVILLAQQNQERPVWSRALERRLRARLGVALAVLLVSGARLVWVALYPEAAP